MPVKFPRARAALKARKRKFVLGITHVRLVSVWGARDPRSACIRARRTCGEQRRGGGEEGGEMRERRVEGEEDEASDQEEEEDD